MEVSIGTLDPTDHIHVGGSSRGNMQITDSTEFYHLLSESLYSNKRLAAIREIVCNAWDSHIASNKTDLPIEINMSDEGGFTKISIRDFGTGIPNDEIIEIYGTYGNSTKRKSQLETGGFGLGSKAPFAVTGHFNVVNHRDGQATMYKVVKVGAEGKPEVIEIFRRDSDETGIEVFFNIGSEASEVSDYLTIIENVVKDGGILAKYNGDLLDRIDWDNLELPILVTENYTKHKRSLCVKLGNVIYPLDRHNNEDLEPISKIAFEILNRLPYDSCIVIPMPGNSIRVTPSRESLSYNEYTNANLLKYALPLLNKLYEILLGSLKRYNKILSEKYDLNTQYRLLNAFNSYVGKTTCLTKYDLDCYVGFSSSNNYFLRNVVIEMEDKYFNSSKIRKRLFRIFGDSSTFRTGGLIHNNGYHTTSFISLWRKYGRLLPVHNKKIIFGYNKKQIKEYVENSLSGVLSLNDDLFKTDKSYGNRFETNYIYFICKPKDNLNLESLKDDLIRFGFEPIILDKPARAKPVKRVVKKSPKLSAYLYDPNVSSLNDSLNESTRFQSFSEKDKDKYFIIEYRHTSGSNKIIRKWSGNGINILQKILDKPILLVHGSKKAKQFKEAGFKCAIEEFKTQSSKWYKSKELLILLTLNGLIGRYRHILSNQLLICAHSKKLLNRYFGIKFKNDPVYDNWIHISNYIYSLSYHEVDYASHIIQKIIENLPKEFQSLNPDNNKSFAQLYSYLNLYHWGELIYESRSEHHKHKYSNIRRDVLKKVENFFIYSENKIKEMTNE